MIIRMNDCTVEYTKNRTSMISFVYVPTCRPMGRVHAAGTTVVLSFAFIFAIYKH